ncbi:Ovate protein family, C-terminal [Parasponia andersonii]|uniref:Transcription repressor n=1 Tax=Parasponia andersonii TaxID=3476 RepID=A0A2P5AVA9_PARAD|nr:Ovate protein family, C-terminal [Parasponia andersonii]
MSKSFKLKIPRFINSFQFCRFKNPSSLPENPKPAIYRLSPVNPRAFDIGYPNGPPAPPATTPEYSFTMRRAGTSSKIESDGCKSCGRSRSCAQYFFSDCSTETTSFAVAEKYHIKKKKGKEMSKQKSKGKSYRTTTSSGNVNSFSGNDYDEDDDSLVLLDSSRSFSNELPDEPIVTKVEDSRIQRLKRESRTSTSSKNRKLGSKTVLWQETAAAEGNYKVRESVAVVKKSEDPYEDFKRSMLEMIMEKQMFEASDLEELLQCFLTLNSRQYHGVIVEAFSEIWEILFSHSPLLKHRLSF